MQGGVGAQEAWQTLCQPPSTSVFLDKCSFLGQKVLLRVLCQQGWELLKTKVLMFEEALWSLLKILKERQYHEGKVRSQ